MLEETEAKQKVEKPAAPEPLRKRVIAWMQQGWRPAGTLVALGLALLLTWHVINGKHGLQVWHQIRAQDKELQQQIHDLQQENDAMRKQIEELKSDPDAIERKAREELHYARQNEVIYTLPQPPAQQTNPAK